jgi:hypothetical protein
MTNQCFVVKTIDKPPRLIWENSKQQFAIVAGVKNLFTVHVDDDLKMLTQVNRRQGFTNTILNRVIADLASIPMIRIRAESK